MKAQYGSPPEPTPEEEVFAEKAIAVMGELGLPAEYRHIVEDLLCTWEPEDIDHEKVEAMYAVHRGTGAM
ncbi:hypothetical protein BI084_gp41 [Gordonia phage Terapin]|uniref:Uncharacterized protein n=5 Tax=Terapinvirus terapin TaxID=2734283 RepID=A0A345MB80_9CAUD|nr:hypothetical protein BI084_gp41 [Gordonia phage Terapin]AVP43317.1 hypothetical protein PBI_DJOKOVIC_40 [Gordonia phage Djokovic]AXH67751.1 hypothetical protein SEA_BEYONCAGE_40 [Gordonia phage Beyoncage]QOC56185.1 hypothetical protein SEA_SIENNA_40 [Gordonia phage Sienna]QOC56610.1 hypothetical protein SEA_BITESIZE_40 [Gordonia phage BiteSize]QYW00843.1 hypothetical protein SEA_MADI_40 [Gordonia phage Madi]